MKKKIISKIILYMVLFVVVLLISTFTKLPVYFDSYVYYEDYQLKAHLYLIAYRIVIYLLFPLLVSFIEKLTSKYRKFGDLLIENFNFDVNKKQDINKIIKEIPTDKLGDFKEGYNK